MILQLPGGPAHSEFRLAKLLSQVGQHTGWDLDFEMGFKSGETPEPRVSGSVH